MAADADADEAGAEHQLPHRNSRWHELVRDLAALRGRPKAFAGSTAWTNYTASAEITQNTAGGDAGVIVCWHEQNIGVDGHRGYYAGIAAGATYRLTVRAVGSQFTATVYLSGNSTALATLTVTDSTFPAGQVAVRNLDTSASFDNVTVSAS